MEYDKVTEGDIEWNMQLFEDDDLKDYFENCIKVQKSVYETVIYQSGIEYEFAKKLDERDDIKLFVKLPDWFKIETPIGTYNPDWAVVKPDDEKIYLVRETKDTKDYEKLRNSEAKKIRCGRKHFKSLGVDFDVVINADSI
jgi:type III restriction enzyme